MSLGIVEQLPAEVPVGDTVDEFERLLKKAPSDFDRLMRGGIGRHVDDFSELLRGPIGKRLLGPLGGIIDILTPSELGSGELPGGPGSANEPQYDEPPPPLPRRNTAGPNSVPRPAPAPLPPPEPEIEEIVITGRVPKSVPQGGPVVAAPSPISSPSAIQTAGIALGALTGLLLLRRAVPARRRRAAPAPDARAEPAPLPESIPAPAPAPQPAPAPLPQPAPRPAPVPSSSPPLTPVIPPGAGCTPCDPKATRREQKRKRDEKRKQCKQFLSVRVPAHKRKMCIADLAKYLQRKLERTAKAAVRKKIIAALEAQGVPASALIKATRRPRRPKAEVDVGGVEIDFEDLLGS